jgi:hypothetical protein
MGGVIEMHRVVEDHAKKRLTDPVDIAKAILAMSAKGVPADRLLPELMKIFYIDLDQYNAVIHGRAANDRTKKSGSFAA